MADQHLPAVYLRFRARFPDLATSLDGLGHAADAAGPLDERTRCLVKLGAAIGGAAEGAVRSNARRALQAGASEAEVLHVVALAISPRGFPAAVAAFSWIEEELSHTSTDAS